LRMIFSFLIQYFLTIFFGPENIGSFLLFGLSLILEDQHSYF
jgi:hypothetical protein